MDTSVISFERRFFVHLQRRTDSHTLFLSSISTDIDTSSYHPKPPFHMKRETLINTIHRADKHTRERGEQEMIEMAKKQSKKSIDKKSETNEKRNLEIGVDKE
eukprot:TRINITY_DN355_c0_g2_i1.p2 TRINITY_DN355_c0_g2~~TRINITY_DN355_c0_g2_i1.p2  ORF type:complete len:103 (-),score=16.05 TRINITY_DN355_c0_g2_i1:192-500(-)